MSDRIMMQLCSYANLVVVTLPVNQFNGVNEMKCPKCGCNRAKKDEGIWCPECEMEWYYCNPCGIWTSTCCEICDRNNG